MINRNTTKVIKAQRIIDGTGKEPITHGVVVIEGRRIVAIGKDDAVAIPKDAELVNMDCTLMPGLIDAHLHIAAQNVVSFNSFRAAIFEVTPQLQMLYALLHAQLCFEMGFTTLRDMGWASFRGLFVNEMVALRDSISLGLLAGPRILVGGWTAITGNHLDLILPISAIRQPGVTADGPWELRKLARQNIRSGCDFIKTCISGGGGTDHDEPDIRNMTQEELEAIVDEAHAFKKPCACHCFTPDTQRMAIQAKVDTLEHCVFTDQDAVTKMLETGKTIIPTLAHRSDRAIEVRRRMGASEFSINKMKRLQPHTKATFQKIHQAGVKIAMGTDTNYDPEMGTNAYELEIYVEYGMTPMEAILAATRNAAQAISMDKEIGTLEVGKLADIIAVQGDPLKDIRVLQDKTAIQMVMKEGTIYVDRREGQRKDVINPEIIHRWKRPV